MMMKPLPTSDGTQTQVGLFFLSFFGEAPSSARRLVRLRCAAAHRERRHPLFPIKAKMGGGNSVFKREDLEVYEACTCLSSAEVLELYEKFTDLGGVRASDAESEGIARGPGGSLIKATGDGGTESSGSGGVKAPRDKIIEQPELRNNPFRVRLCEIFSSEPRDSSTYGDLSFDEFVDLYNVMSPRASKETKTQTAFRLYDFDGNGYLTHEDIAQLLKLLSTMKNQKMLFDKAEVKDIVDRVMRDCDIDGNNRLSYAEFSKVVGRIPDFTTKFVIYIQ